MSYYKLEDKINEINSFAEHGHKDAKSTGIASLDGYVALKKGYPLYVGGAPHAGKSEFVMELLVNTSILYNWKHFIYCGESGNEEHVYYELLSKYLSRPYKYAEEKDRVLAQAFISEHFVVVNQNQEYSIDSFNQAIDEAENELHIKFDTVMFDPFNDLEDERSKHGGRDDKFLSDVLKKTRINSAIKNRIDILVTHIADVRAVKDDDTGRFYMRPALPNEWAGGRAWWRRAFTMIMIYRPPSFLTDENGKPYEENESHVYIQKSKPKGIGKLGIRPIFWDYKKNRYYSYSESGQMLYSCETEKSVEKLEPNLDFENEFDIPF